MLKTVMLLNIIKLSQPISWRATHVSGKGKTTPHSAVQGYRSNMMLQLTITRGEKTSDRLIQQLQYKRFGCTSAQRWIEKQKKNASPRVTPATGEKCRGTAWLGGLHDNITKNFWSAGVHFLSKVVNSSLGSKCGMNFWLCAQGHEPARGKCNLPALTLSADPRPRADGIQFQSTGSVIGRCGPEVVQVIFLWPSLIGILTTVLSLVVDQPSTHMKSLKCDIAITLTVTHGRKSQSANRDLASFFPLCTERKREFSITWPFIAATTWQREAESRRRTTFRHWWVHKC